MVSNINAYKRLFNSNSQRAQLGEIEEVECRIWCKPK